jgi:hypothetical protein
VKFAQQRLDLRVERRVAQHVADDHAPAEPTGGGLHGEHVLQPVGHGFFQEQVAPELHRAQRMRTVLRVLGADHDDVGWLAGREHLFGGGIALERRRLGRLAANKGHAALDRVGSGHEGEALGHPGRDTGIGPCPGAAATESQGETSHQG